MKHLVLTILSLLVVHSRSVSGEAPNFILFYADDLGYADTSVQMMQADPSTKHDFIQTPGLDRLARLGSRFTAAYAPTPTCTGSRLSLQCGKSSARMQCRNVFDVLSAVQRPEGYDSETTIGEMLKESGMNYITAMFGKGCSTMGRFDEAGYDITDENPGEPGGNGNGHGSYWNVKQKTPFPPDNPKRLHSLRRDSVAFINEYAGEQPIFMIISHYAPHVPHMATKEAFQRVKKRWIALGRETEGIDTKNSSLHRAITYAAMIEEMDMNVGAIIDALKARGELDNTYIVFTSDNGGGASHKRKIQGKTRRFNGPLREGKRSVFEGGIRVPTVITGPGIKAGSECDVPIVQWDFLPTFHDLSGSKAPLPEGVDGGSLRDVFVNGSSGRVDRSAPGIVHHYTCHYHPPISSIIIGDYKLMRHLNSGELKLFNIKSDYGEEHNLAVEMTERAAAMDKVRQQYIDAVDGGTVEQVRQTHYDLMDKFSRRSKESYRKKLAQLKNHNPTDFAKQKSALLKELNQTLLKNAISKEKTRRGATFHSWTETPPKRAAEQHVLANWEDYSE